MCSFLSREEIGKVLYSLDTKYGWKLKIEILPWESWRAKSNESATHKRSQQVNENYNCMK